jgi:hypothetical protein
MSNTFEKDLAKVGHVALNVVDGHYIADALTYTEKAAAVLATAITDQPELKSTLTTLVTKVEAIGADLVVDATGKGLNLASDAATVAAVEDLLSWSKATLVPLIESIWGQLTTDVKTS